jgi:hypothetical protein
MEISPNRQRINILKNSPKKSPKKFSRKLFQESISEPEYKISTYSSMFSVEYNDNSYEEVSEQFFSALKIMLTIQTSLHFIIENKNIKIFNDKIIININKYLGLSEVLINKENTYEKYLLCDKGCSDESYKALNNIEDLLFNEFGYVSTI